MRNTPTKSTSLIASGLLIVLCAWGLIFASKWLVSEYYAKKVADQIDLWESYGDIYFLEEWETAVGNINRAINLHENNAKFHELKGFLYESRRFAPYPQDESLNPMENLRQLIQIQTDAREHALAAYRKSVSLRPVWPPVWIKLAILKGRSKEFDEEFYTAVSSSYLYGKNLPFVQNDLTEMSLRFFEEIQMQEGLKKMQLDHLANSFGSGGVFADWVNRFRLMREICEQLVGNGYSLNGSAVRSCERVMQ